MPPQTQHSCSASDTFVTRLTDGEGVAGIAGAAVPRLSAAKHKFRRAVMISHRLLTSCQPDSQLHGIGIGESFVGLFVEPSEGMAHMAVPDFIVHDFTCMK